MSSLTTRERFSRIYNHQDADRIPIADNPWRATVERWHREGLPEGVSYIDYFDLDKIASINPNNSPRYEIRTLEETEEYKITTTDWGVTFKDWKHAASAPEFLDFTLIDRDSWAKAKARMTPTRDRINWEHLRANYARWREEGYWIEGGLWFGFDITHSWAVGTERLLCALIEDPEWCSDMFSHQLETGLALLQMVLDEGYSFDTVTWPDDMGYKGTQFFSLDIYRELMKPYHKRAIEWAHARGIKARLHSCGNINPFIPELIEIGLDALNPLEVKAGMDPVKIKRQYGRDLVLHGGVNAVLWDHPDQIKAEMERVIPVLKENGGYIFASDHSIPSSVSLEDFRQIIDLAKSLGSY